jgi:EAL and modified HD-GYP domain-containing signal transduction protein
MLSKYLKIFRGEKQADELDDWLPEQTGMPTIDEIVPLMDRPPQAASTIGQAVDTDDSDTIVTDVLAIDTHGKQTQVSELLQRFLGRQPIMDVQGNVVGYELRIKKAGPPPVGAAETLQQMYDEMLLASMFDLDIHQLRGNKLIFAQISPLTLDTGFLDRLPGEGLVLALMRPSAEADIDALAARCAHLKTMGYRIALDDPDYRAELAPLFKQADYIRIGALNQDAVKLGEMAVAASNQANTILIANQVEADEIYDVCRKLGFKLFQGYSFTRLRPGKGTKIDGQRLRVMELLNMAINKAEIQDIEEVFKRDPVLSYKLLRYINSPANSLLQPARSLSHALMVLGYDPLYRWLTLLLFASGQPDYRTLALMKNALVRARFTELLGRERLQNGQREGLFIVGVFSLLDALLNVPLDQALAHLKLPPQIVHALLKREGIYAPYLELALAMEEGEDRILETYAAACGIGAEEINRAHAEALAWAEGIDA